jgi:2-polyprenyl-3-methyl-5-hydroxy-6-metoxy-1,4-benzoquinol methylase
MSRRPPLLSLAIQQRRYTIALPFISGNVLDIGCGRAMLANLLPSDAQYIGVDHNQLFLESSRRRHPHHQFYPADLEGQTLPEEIRCQRFDTIALMAVLEHLAQPLQILNQLAALLSHNGRVVATTPTPIGHHVHALGARLGLFYREAAADHKSRLSKHNLTHLFQAAGLRVAHYRQFEFGCNQLIIGELPTE